MCLLQSWNCREATNSSEDDRSCAADDAVSAGAIQIGLGDWAHDEFEYEQKRPFLAIYSVPQINQADNVLEDIFTVLHCFTG